MTFNHLRGIATPEQQQQALEYASSPQKQAEAERFKQRLSVLSGQIKAKTDAKRHEKERAERRKTIQQLCDAYVISLLISLALICLIALASGKPLVRVEALLCFPLALVFIPTVARLINHKD